ncbi:MAG: hypothetical protein LBK61_05680 [Spirochaetaceae bacterium]|jgi:hypothetical protein|nr:hypothetical protein [Spirochaetaceae bacterium]
MIKIFDDNKAILAILATQREYDLEGDWNLNGVIEFLKNRLKREVETNLRWETTDQYEKRTGKAWPDDWAVYYRQKEHGAWSDWVIAKYSFVNNGLDNIDHIIICATEAGRPPDDLRPEEPENA